MCYDRTTDEEKNRGALGTPEVCQEVGKLCELSQYKRIVELGASLLVTGIPLFHAADMAAVVKAMKRVC